MKAVAFYNNKGGVGKTTLSTQMAVFCGEYQKAVDSRYRVLFIDLDEQMNGTQFMSNIQSQEKYLTESINTDLSAYYPHSIIDIIKDENFPPEQAVVPTMFENVDMIPGNQNIKDFAMKINNNYGYTILNHQIRKLADTYQYVFIDCPPAKTTGEAALGLFLADAVIVPILADPYSLNSLSTPYQMIEKVSRCCYKYTNHHLMNLGIVFNQFQSKGQLDRHLLETFLDKASFPFSGICLKRAVKVSQVNYCHSPIIDLNLFRSGQDQETAIGEDFCKLAYYILSSLAKGEPNVELQ